MFQFISSRPRAGVNSQHALRLASQFHLCHLDNIPATEGLRVWEKSVEVKFKLFGGHAGRHGDVCHVVLI